MRAICRLLSERRVITSAGVKGYKVLARPFDQQNARDRAAAAL